MPLPEHDVDGIDAAWLHPKQECQASTEVTCLLGGKTIGWLTNRRRFDGGAMEAEARKDPRVAQNVGYMALG